MAQIKIYQQGQLASPVVGTPGVNPAGAEAVNAALSSNAGRIEQQQELNRASINSTNTMRGAALDANTVINRSMAETRQNSINNQNALLMSQVDLGNEAKQLQGQRTVWDLNQFRESFQRDRYANYLTKEAAQRRQNAVMQQQQQRQDQVDARNSLAPAIGQMTSYAAGLNQQITSGAIDGRKAGDAYTQGIDQIKSNIMEGLPSSLSEASKDIIAEQVSQYQIGQAKAITEFGYRQYNQNLIKGTTQATSALADQSGVQPYTDATGTTYPATSTQALDMTLAKINNRLAAQNEASGPAAAAKIIGDTKVAAFKNWAQANINNGNTGVVQKYLTPDKDGKPFVEQYVPTLDAGDVKSLDTSIRAKDGEMRTIQDREAEHVEMVTKSNVMNLVAPAEASFDNRGVQYQARQQLLQGLNDHLNKPSSEANTRAIQQYMHGLNTVNTNIHQIDTAEKEAQRHAESEAKADIREGKAAQREAKAQVKEEKQQRRFDESNRYNSPEAGDARAEILGLSKEMATDKKLKGTKEDFQSVKNFQDKLDKATKLGYYSRDGIMDSQWSKMQALVIDKTDRIHTAASKPGLMDFLGLARDKPVIKADSEKLKEYTLSGAHQKIHQLYNPTGDRLHGLAIDEHANHQLLDAETAYRNRHPQSSEDAVYQFLKSYKNGVITPGQLVKPTGQ